jgi:1-acyl-sn-glycerol-3-phosphate acyltransferase
LGPDAGSDAHGDGRPTRQSLGRRVADRTCSLLARLLARIFFRRLEVAGGERIPAAGPLLVVANHVNGLIDPLLVAATLPFFPRMLGKSTLWDIAALRPVLALAGVVPVYRRQDPGVDVTKNADMFARTHEALAAGGVIALFPEGLSHNQPDLAPLRTGAARIVLDAEERFGPLGVQLLPVGLTFEDKGRFRSRALVQVGESMAVAPYLEAFRQQPQETVRALTAVVDEALRAVTLNYRSWDEAALIARAVELFNRPDVELPGGRRLAESFELQHAFITGSQAMAQRYPEEVAAATRKVAEYDGLLRLLRLRDDQVAARYPAPGALGWFARTLGVQLVTLPLAAIGSLFNGPPFWLAGRLARRFRDQPDQWATWKLFPSLVLYPAYWLLAAAAIGALAAAFGAGAIRWGLLALLLAPLTGWFSMRHRQQRGRWWREIRAFWLLKTRQRGTELLRERRAAAYEAVALLAQRYLSSGPDGNSRPDGPVERPPSRS